MVRLAAARAMRKAPSSAERVLWKLLRDRRLEGFKFRRQVPIGPYIADFVCFRHRLLVEADGYFHDARRDAVRDAWFTTQGFRTLRFETLYIHNHPEKVLQAIAAASLPSPLAGEGVGEADG